MGEIGQEFLWLATIGGFTLFIVLLCIAMIARSRLAKQESPIENEIFTPRPLLNNSELSLLKTLDQVIASMLGPEVRIFAQVSYGEFLRGNTRASHARVNQKRADFVMADINSTVICVIEYQGPGHYGRGPAARTRTENNDAVKRKALVSAGIPLIEVPAKYTRESVERALSSFLN